MATMCNFGLEPIHVFHAHAMVQVEFRSFQLSRKPLYAQFRFTMYNTNCVYHTVGSYSSAEVSLSESHVSTLKSHGQINLLEVSNSTEKLLRGSYSPSVQCLSTCIIIRLSLAQKLYSLTNPRDITVLDVPFSVVLSRQGFACSIPRAEDTSTGKASSNWGFVRYKANFQPTGLPTAQPGSFKECQAPQATSSRRCTSRKTLAG